MIHIHGTPFSGPRECAKIFFKDRYALIPFKRPENMEAVKQVSKAFVIDNSAFSYWRTGETMDYEKYLLFVEKHQHEKLLWSIIPDVIDGTDEENDKYIEMWPTNFKGVPVYHLHEPIERLIRLADKFECVAIGSSGAWANPNSDKWWLRIKTIFDTICDSNGKPPCKLHGLRMLNPDIFTKIPLDSADSTNVVRNCNTLGNFGRYIPITAAKRAIVIAEIIEKENSPLTWKRNGQTVLF